jgi:SEC-C motif
MAPIPVVCQSCRRLWIAHNIIGGSGNARVTIMNSTVSPCPYCGGTGSIPNGVYELAGSVVRYLASGAVSIPDLRRLQDVLRDAQQRKAKSSEVVSEIKRKVPSAEGITASFASPASLAMAAWLQVLLTIITVILVMRGQSSGSLTETQVEHAVEQALKSANVTRDHPAAAAPTVAPSAPNPAVRPTGKVGWNHHCPCGSRRKYKKCCGSDLYAGR